MKLEPILSTLKYEINLIDKLKESQEYSYYIPYIFLLLLKHYADFLLSKDLGKYVVSFDYISVLKERDLIDNDEELFIRKCVEITRRRDNLVKKYAEIDTNMIEKIVSRIKESISRSV
ncbi:MAG: hypothetical protein N3D81_02140 [Spirochaetes bacterium]|nr:hypothetical protein [Spirochaetota bacterium]